MRNCSQPKRKGACQMRCAVADNRAAVKREGHLRPSRSSMRRCGSPRSTAPGSGGRRDGQLLGKLRQPRRLLKPDRNDRHGSKAEVNCNPGGFGCQPSHGRFCKHHRSGEEVKALHGDVRFTPESGHRSTPFSCPESAMCRLMHCSNFVFIQSHR